MGIQSTIAIRGVPALLLILAVVAIGGFRALTARAQLDGAASEELATWIRAEYASRQMAGATPETMTPGAVDSLLALQDITFPSIRARGKPDDMVIRAEIRVDGGPPPDGRAVRYFRMEYSTLTGWRYRRETVALVYYLKLL